MTRPPHGRVSLFLLCPAFCTCVAIADPHGTRPGTNFHIDPLPGQAASGTIEIHGVAAGPFDAALWQAGVLHFEADVRMPLMSPRLAGTFRNIYAPSAVAVPGGWRVFYGGWDGVPTGNDRIYSLLTPDFIDFGEPQTDIEHGAFTHVCNVSAVRADDRAFAMVCTAYPDEKGLNKPAFFSSLDGRSWNGAPAPYAAKRGDIVVIDGYPPYRDAEINGINVLLREDGVYRLYFGNWTVPGQIHRASGADARQLRYDGPCLDSHHMVNDVKKLATGERRWYLMALHANSNRLWYALSEDGMRFGPERELTASLGRDDRFIVAVGWVTQGTRLLGFLYGAGAVPELNRNRIFARWLQKRVVFVAEDGHRFEPTGALGPDRQIFAIPNGHAIQGRFELFAEDGRTAIGRPVPMRVTPGGVYRITTTRSSAD